MAEIKVERKRRSLLPLLLGLLLLLLIAWWFLSRSNDAPTAAASADTATVATGIAPPAPITNDTAAGTLAPGAQVATGEPSNAALGDYVEFVGNGRVERNEDEQHAYTAGALRRLATVLEGMNPTGAARAQVDLIRQKADSLQITSPGDDRHADMTRAAFTAAAEAMRTLPAAGGDAVKLEGLTRAAAAMRPERHMLEQKDQIQAFFDAARAALQAMGGTGAA